MDIGRIAFLKKDRLSLQFLSLDDIIMYPKSYNIFTLFFKNKRIYKKV